MEEITVDASVIIKLVIPEDMSDKANVLIGNVRAKGIKLIAPYLYEPETVSVLSRKVWEGKLTETQADAALESLRNIPVKLLSFAGQADRAWIIARQFNMRYAYDAFYVALAEHRGCELWTADKKLYSTVHSAFPFVNWLGNYRRSQNECDRSVYR